MLFINPATEKFGGFLSRYVPVGIPVAIGCLSAYLEKHNIRCRVLDEEIVDITPSVLREALAGLEKPYVVGIHCLTAHVGRGYQVARLVKTQYPDAVVVFGGLHPTALPEEPLRTGYVDYVVRGEGEHVMLQLYKAIRGEGDPTSVLGVSYTRGDQCFHNPEATLIPDINEIPMFPYHLFKHPKYDMGFMTTSRGCPYRCSYCSIRLMTGTTYRYKSAGKILEELSILVDTYKQKQVVFYDDNFCLQRKRVHTLCDMLVANGFNRKVTLSVQTRADNLLEYGGEELVRHMAEAGFRHIGFGLETGVQRLAELARKDETIECHLEATKLCKKYGMDVSLFMIFGFPTETDEDRETSHRIVKNARVLATKFNNLIPYPGTPIYNEVKDGARIYVAPNWSNFNSVLSMTKSIFDKTPLPYVPETCSEFQLKRDIIRYNLKSYVNWDSIAGIFGHTKGAGWFMLPKRWYLNPREFYEIARIGVQLVTNMVIAFLPLRVTEPFMNWLNPQMKKRPRIKNYDPAAYKTRDWDELQMRRKAQLLTTARLELKTKGAVKLDPAAAVRNA